MNLIDITALTRVNILIIFFTGIIISLLVLFGSLLSNLSRYKLSILVIPQILVVIQICFLLPSDLIYYSSEDLVMFFDLRIPYSFLIGVPVLIMIYNVYSFKLAKYNLISKLIILYTIDLMDRGGKNLNIKKFFKKQIEMDPKRKYKLIIRFSNILIDMKKSEFKLILNRRNSYMLTDKAKSILQDKNSIRILKKQIKNYSIVSNNLEVWDERSLRFYSFKRKLKNILVK